MNYLKAIFIILMALFFNGMFGFPFNFPCNNNNQTGSDYVVDNTNENHSCEGSTSFYHTIQDAIDASTDNSHINICDGTYNESISVNKNNLYIKKNDSATGDVIISNSDTVFKLNNIKNIFFESLKIKSSSNDGIRANRDVDDFGIKNCEIDAVDNGIQLSRNAKYLSISDTNITASNNGVIVNRRVTNGININNTNIVAKNYGLIIVRDVSKKINLNHININTTTKDSIHFSRAIYNDVNITDSSFVSGDDGIEFDRYLNKNISITNTTIKSVGNGIYFHRSINGGINIDNVDINSTSNIGIKFLRYVDKYCTLNRVNISSFDRSLYFNSAFINPVITNSSFISENSDAIYTKTTMITKLVLKNSCIKTEKISSFGLNLYINNSSSDILNNCFYAKKTNKLAKARKTHNNFDGNYWDGHTGNYNMNNIYDDNPAKDCKHKCWGQHSTNTRFDAWDTTKNIDDRNITTKKVNKQFSITIVSLNKDGNGYENFNGTVCSCINNDSSTCFKNQFVEAHNSNETVQGDPTFTINKAIKNTTIDIHWEENVNKSCSELDEDNSTNSTDNFAIIPTKFILDINTAELKAGENYLLDINATDANNNLITNYNQIFSDNDKNLSLFFNSKQNGVEFNKTYTFEINGSGFKNDFNVDDIGKYTLKMIDTEYAIVDEDDTNLSDRTIDGNLTFIVKPHHFDINITKHEASTDQDWVYMAQDFSDMNYTLKADLSARNKQDHITTHFDKNEFARDINTTIIFDSNMTNNELTQFYNQFDNDFNITTNEFNTSKESFNHGISKISLIYKVDKNSAETLRPIRTNIKKFDLPNLSNDEKYIESLDDNLTWYYSKIITYDVITNSDITKNHFFVLLYKENKKDFTEVTLNWFQNEDDNSTITTGFSFTPSSNSIINNTTDHNVTFIDYKTGRVDYNITKNIDEKAVIHMRIPKYLWYSYGVDSPYDISSGSNCIQHPCSIYTYEKIENNTTTVNISSGKYKGGRATVKPSGKRVRFGIKVYR